MTVCRPGPRLALLAALLVAGEARAVEVDTLDVSRNGDRYRVAMQVRLDTSADRAFAVFSDYNNLPRLNPAVKEIRYENDSPAGADRLYARLRLCFSFFCRSLQQTQDMYREPGPNGGRLSAVVLPERSDLHYGSAVWTIDRCASNAQTCLSFVAELEPKFWIPPVIGPWVMERKLREEALQTSQGIERLAKALP